MDSTFTNDGKMFMIMICSNQELVGTNTDDGVVIDKNETFDKKVIY
jgi:hypothetical protein